MWQLNVKYLTMALLHLIVLVSCKSRSRAWMSENYDSNTNDLLMANEEKEQSFDPNRYMNKGFNDERLASQLDNVAEYLVPREKKSKYRIDEERQPLEHHNRKSYSQALQPGDDISPVATCTRELLPQMSMIIDTETSLSRGAKFLFVRYVTAEEASQATNINGLHSICKEKCCETKDCDTALLSTRIRSKGYGCYLYSCNDLCILKPHDDYHVFIKKDAEQTVPINRGDNEKPNQSNKNEEVITTGHNTGACHKQYEFMCVSDKRCIPVYDVCNGFDDCADKSDEKDCSSLSNDKNSISNTNKNKQEKPKENYLLETDPFLVSSNKDIANDYSDFAKLKENAKFVEHLDLLERLSEQKDQKESKPLSSLSASEKNADDVIFKTPEDFLNALMKEASYESQSSKSQNKNTYEQKANDLSYKKNTKTTTKSTTSSKAKYHFYDSMNGDMFINPAASSTEKSLTEEKWPSQALPIVLLILGIFMLVSFFLYLVSDTKFARKRIKWLNKKNQEKNLNIEADYLINGMYL